MPAPQILLTQAQTPQIPPTWPLAPPAALPLYPAGLSPRARRAQSSPCALLFYDGEQGFRAILSQPLVVNESHQQMQNCRGTATHTLC